MMLNVFLNLAPGDLAKCTDLAQLQSELKLARRRRRRELPQGTARVPVDGQDHSESASSSTNPPSAPSQDSDCTEAW